MKKHKLRDLPVQQTPNFHELPVALQEQILQLAQQKLGRGEIVESQPQSINSVSPIAYTQPGSPIFLVVNNTNTNANDNDNKPKVESVAASLSENANPGSNSGGELDFKTCATAGMMSLLLLCGFFTIALRR